MDGWKDGWTDRGGKAGAGRIIYYAALFLSFLVFFPKMEQQKRTANKRVEG